MKLSFEILTGREEIKFDKEVLSQLEYLKEEASKRGFLLEIASGFRNFERQLFLFNKKVEKGMDLFSILRYSAIPGASRHHWGTDFDIFDKKNLPQDYKVKLSPDEFEYGGPFYELSVFLEEFMKQKDCPFFSPYDQDRGGVAPEKWHISHKKSEEFFKAYSFEVFEKNLELSNLLLKEEILRDKEFIFERYFLNISKP